MKITTTNMKCVRFITWLLCCCVGICVGLPRQAITHNSTAQCMDAHLMFDAGGLEIDDVIALMELANTALAPEKEPANSEPLLGDPRLHPEMFLASSSGTVIPTGERFQLFCECNKALAIPLNNKYPMEWPNGKCGAGEVKIKLLLRGDGYTEDQVRNILGSPIFFNWAKIAEHHFSTFEGRTDVPILGLAGGDMAEFISALDIFEEMIARHLSDGECVWYLRQYLAYTKKRTFYMSTDTVATRMIQTSLGIQGLDLREKPNPSQRAAILAALTLPEHIGNAHLRAMMSKPDEYDVRPGLPASVIRAFFWILWDHNEPLGRKLRLVELDGVGQEKAVIKVTTGKACRALGLAPLFTPRSDKGNLFISHQSAASTMRWELAVFFSMYHRWVNPQIFIKMANQNGDKYEQMAIWKEARMSNNLPVYEVTIQ
eukprot:c11434_g1_i1.p1 GENE.c11434_g1_i1~~c11434_g1_i1.p1  ORF type:complete len:429 (-),score=84.12 c11434_g1_i1:22-1308(-)